ncbi:secreted RxLR effector peptide protein, putative [Phytophthora infestans T30-4]
MQFLYRALLVLAAFVLDSTSADVIAKVVHLSILRFTRPVEENLIKRHLRVVDDNERGFPRGPSLEKITETIESVAKKIWPKSKPSQSDVPDEKVSQLLGAAKPVRASVEAAARLKSLQTQRCLDEGKSTREVFQLLELNKFMVPYFKRLKASVLVNRTSTPG